MVGRAGIGLRCRPGAEVAPAIDITNITTTEDITITLCNTFRSTYLTTMNMYLCLTEHITIGIESMYATIS